MKQENRNWDFIDAFNPWNASNPLVYRYFNGKILHIDTEKIDKWTGI